MGHLDWLAFAQGNFGFMQFGEDLFDGVTKTWHAALLSARPQHRIWTRLRGLGQPVPEPQSWATQNVRNGLVSQEAGGLLFSFGVMPPGMNLEPGPV
jgi:hypothetical protein